jgi:hypothetical protein
MPLPLVPILVAAGIGARVVLPKIIPAVVKYGKNIFEFKLNPLALAVGGTVAYGINEKNQQRADDRARLDREQRERHHLENLLAIRALRDDMHDVRDDVQVVGSVVRAEGRITRRSANTDHIQTQEILGKISRQVGTVSRQIDQMCGSSGHSALTGAFVSAGNTEPSRSFAVILPSTPVPMCMPG